MSLICYVEKNFSRASREVIEHAGTIIAEYTADGYDLTLRQIYYQFVTRDLLPDDRRWRWTGMRWVRDPNGIKNAQPNYLWLGNLISDGRLAGLIDWEAIVDRTRRLSELAHWDSPGDIVAACSRQFRVDRWANQHFRPEVWIEKEALAGVFERICHKLDVPFFACRGYVSQSAMYRAAQRLAGYDNNGQTPIVFHFGDHDPSGIDMTRDNMERLQLLAFRSRAFRVKRIALNEDQVKQYAPPPNPAKTSDSRFASYAERFGTESWELDALDPSTLADLVRVNIEAIRDDDAWEESGKAQKRGRKALRDMAKKLKEKKR